MSNDTDPEDHTPLPDWAEEYFAQQRQWWRMLRETGVMSDADALAEIHRWTTNR